MPKRNATYYAGILARKYNISKKNAVLLLNNAFKNMARAIEKGDDIRIPHFGHIYFNKKAFAKYLKSIEVAKKKKNDESRRKE